MRNLYEKWLGQILVSSKDSSQVFPHPNSISTDSRNIQRGQWFLPLAGEKFDGHQFVNTTVEKTGGGFFYEPAKVGLISHEYLDRGLPVTSTLQCLQAVALGWRQHQKNLTLIALTGSVGKTTTREMAKAIFSSQGKTHGTERNDNNEIGVPLTLLKIREDDRFFILELGARHVGDIDFLCKTSDPDIVACLNVGVSHLGEFGSLENLFSTKMEIYSGSRKDAICICPSDDKRIQDYLQNLGRKTISFGRTSNADIKILSNRWLADGGMEVTISDRSDVADFQLGLGHEAFPINLSAAVAMASAAGLEISVVKESLNSFVGLPGRYHLERIGGITVIDDCYNAAPQSMKAGIASVHQAFRDKKKVLVLGDMLELGPTSDMEHFKVGEGLSGIDSVSLLVTVGESGRIIGKGAISKGLNPNAVISFLDVDELIANSSKVTGAGEVLYIKASNGIGLRKFVNQLRQERS
jgi:UDP-N-acetylmuramoyl-tripeptide--D-alanyl-D-alanine ligase